MLVIFRSMESCRNRGSDVAIWTPKISKSRGPQISAIWAAENETLKKFGVGACGTLSSTPEKREVAVRIGGLGAFLVVFGELG